VTWFEREGDQQPAQPGARNLGEDAVVHANLEWSKHPDLHVADFAMRDWQAPNADAAQAIVKLSSLTSTGCGAGRYSG
jgi:hypothetical protein